MAGNRRPPWPARIRMTSRLYAPMMRSGETYATAALELDSKCGSSLGRRATGKGRLREWMEECSHRRSDHRVYQCHDWTGSQNNYISPHACHSGIVLAGNQCADV